MQIRNRIAVAACLLSIAFVGYAQTPAQPPAQGGRGGAQGGRGGRGPGGGGGGGFSNAYPQHAQADPAVVARGKTIYSAQCAFCHGQDARGGGEGGPSLIRSEIVLKDQNGELIASVVQNGRPGMPKFDLKPEQISDIAAFLHSFRVSGYDAARNRPPSILVGDAKAGEAYFKSKCASCHSAGGDLKGFASKFNDDRTLQQTWLMPGGGGRGFGGQAPAVNVPPTTVTVTAGGKKTEGRLLRIDDFLVVLADADGLQRSFRRDGDNPKVEVHDPLQPHRDLLKVYSDTDIHNVTAYLATLK